MNLVARAFEHAVEAPEPDEPRAEVVSESELSTESGLPTTLPDLRQNSLSTREAAARLGVNSSRIRQRLLARTLFGFKQDGSWWIPEFQFEDDRTVPAAERVFPRIRSSVSPVSVARWFLTPWADLVVNEDRETVVSPKAWLLEGRDPEPVIAQAEAF